MSEEKSCLVLMIECILAAPMFVIEVYIIWALVFGLSTPWGILEFNVFPPSIELMPVKNSADLPL